MGTIGASGFLGVFGDQVFSSTDLNRRSGEVLDHARNGPVTISRNREQFALLKREHAAQLVKVAIQFGPTLDLIAGALCVIEGKEPTTAFAWLKAFDPCDLRKMTNEVLASSVSALRETGDWDSVESIVHAWHESALVTMSGVLEEAMRSPSDESPLPDPRLLLSELK